MAEALVLAGGLGLVDSHDVLELVHDGAVDGLVTHALESADRLVETVLGHIPARGLGHQADADPQGDGGDGAQDDHVAPGVTVACCDGQLREELVVFRGAQGAAARGLHEG